MMENHKILGKVPMELARRFMDIEMAEELADLAMKKAELVLSQLEHRRQVTWFEVQELITDPKIKKLVQKGDMERAGFTNITINSHTLDIIGETKGSLELAKRVPTYDPMVT